MRPATAASSNPSALINILEPGTAFSTRAQSCSSGVLNFHRALNEPNVTNPFFSTGGPPTSGVSTGGRNDHAVPGRRMSFSL